jgi:hypothetical protein
MPKPLDVTLLALVGFALVHCGKTADEPSDAGSSTGDATTAPPVTADAAATDGGIDSSSPMLDAAVPVPKVSCTTEDASVCNTLPPSVCSADVTAVIYFSGGSCVDGSCQWTQSSMPCGSQSHCTQGGCTPPTTK